MAKKRSIFKGNIVSVNFLRRKPVPGAEAAEPLTSRLLSFRNIVLALGIGTGLIFLGNVVPARTSFVIAALLVFAALIITDMISRRKWEADMVTQIQRMTSDNDRLVRDVARSRHEISSLRKSLAEAGTAATTQRDLKPGEGVEQRMIRAIADQLSKMDDAPKEEIVDNGEDLLPEFVSPENLTDTQTVDLVHAAIKRDKIDLFLQPIVNLPQRKTRFYEMLSRIRLRADVHLPAEKYIAVAMEQDLLPAIDNLLLLRGLQHIRDTEDPNVSRAFFCNITSLTLNDPKFMGDLVEFIAQNRSLAPRLVFELGQRDLATMSADTLPILDGLSQLGCRFSMDQVRSTYFDLVHLDARRIRFIKVPAKLLMEEIQQIGGLNRLKRMKMDFDRQGIDLIVERIESEKQVRELLDLDIDYGQGYLFGKPVLA
jgi:cyclic-di-GMP phosphodiesterase TipF (flagellum assembly factor)